MREIKFRGIPTYGKDFVYGSLIININEAGRKEYLIKKHIGIIEIIPETLGQYTGLKDKNGVEIYEGDIVRTTSNELTGKWKHKIYKIEFKEINCVAGAKYMGFDFQFNVDEVEIIGNIYENKELLK